MIVGLAHIPPFSRIDQTNLDQLGKELTKAGDTSVKLRSFVDATSITNWLLRFQEIDAAIVSPEFIEQQPAGTLRHLADLHPIDKASSPLALVVRSNLSSDQSSRIEQAFLKLASSDSGRKILKKLGLAGISPPGMAFKRNTVKPATPQTLSAKDKTASPAQLAKPPEPPPIQKKRTDTADHFIEKPPAPVTKGKPSQAKNSVAPEAAVETAAKPAKNAQPAPTTEKQTKTNEPDKQLADRISGVSPQPVEQVSPRAGAQPRSAPNKRLLLFVALVLLLAILLKLSLFAMRWQNKKKSSRRPEETPAIGNSSKTTEAVADVVAKTNTSPAQGVVIETGKLGSGRVPALLKRCAELSEPVMLKVTKGSSEKLVYFAGGKVSGALIRNATAPGSEVHWNKLGNLLVREELVTEAQLDQGMTLLKQVPKLRFGEALLKLGLIDLTDLRHALTRQAKVIIYSLILFPEGRYQIISGDDSLPPEESISVGATDLIREASHHQSEWLAIRKALPNLNTVLNFTPDGRDKLEKVSISSQQQAALSLIDGKNDINDLCIASSMMDYEVCRFLYLMVKAGVLK